ncbi:protein cappuccino isoform X1 [Ostrinia furnacalis]|uniref:protein cappuccino isoform X1 n=1 Tax=Ostrinia furnacalis TaxID=93504 RepID=UPI00103BB3F7|nr:protein cappuccino isoform X1 [Ostrinia furnacalis]
MGNIQGNEKQPKTGKSPAKSKHFIRNLNRKSPGRDSKKHGKKKGDAKRETIDREFDKTPDSDNNEAIETSDNDTVECVLSTSRRDAEGESASVHSEVTVTRCESRAGPRSPTRDHSAPAASENDSPSESVFTDPLTPLAVELNQCYYSAESDSALDEPPRTLTPSLSAAAARSGSQLDMPHDDAASSLSTDDMEKEEKSDVFDDTSDRGDEKVMGAIISGFRGDHIDRSAHECSHDFRDNRLKACPGQTSFTLSKHRKVELTPVACESSLSMLDNEKDRRHSSVSDMPMGESNVLRKVASLTLDKHAENRVLRPRFVPEKLDFQLYEKFEGQMLLNWFLSSISENNHLKNLLNPQDLKNLGIQYCTHLLAAGVLRQISDKDAPTENIFKPNLMYYWAHMETPASQPVTPGRLHMAAWPPDKELLPQITQDQLIVTNRCNVDNKFFNQNNNEEISDINEAKVTISQLKRKLQELEFQLEKYKINAQIDALNKNLGKSFDSPSQVVAKTKVELMNKEVQTSYEINKLSYRPVIIPDPHSKSNVNIDNAVVVSSCLKDIELKTENRSDKIENYCKLNKSRDYNEAIRKLDVPKSSEDNANSSRDVQDDNTIAVNRNINKCAHHPNNSATCIISCCCCSSDASFLSALTSSESMSNQTECALESDELALKNNTDLKNTPITEMLFTSIKKNVTLETSQYSAINTSSAPSSEIKDGNSYSKLEQNIPEEDSSIHLASLSPPTSSISTSETPSVLICPKPPSSTSQPSTQPPPPLPGAAPSPPPTPGTKEATAATSAPSLSELVLSEHEQPHTPDVPTGTSAPEMSTAPPPIPPPPSAELLIPSSPVAGLGPPPPPMPDLGPPPPMPDMGPPPPPMPDMGPPPPPMPEMGLHPPPMPGMGPPPPPMPGMGPPPPPMPGMGPPPPPMPGMGPPPPPMPGMGPPPPPMPGMGPPPPPMPGMGPPPPPMPGMPGASPLPPPMPGMGPPPPPPISGPPPPPGQMPYSGPVPFPAPPVGGWSMQRSTLRKTPVKPAAPMKPLYWTRILANQVAPPCQGESDSVLLKPLWLEIEETNLDNIEEFTDLFSRQVVKAPVKKKVEVKTKIQPVKILDSKRSQNVGILAQSLHVEFSEIENAIYNFDTSVVSLEALQQIYELRATDEELAMIKEHLKSKSDVPLDRPEAFLHDLSGIPNFAERISCFMFQADFEDAASTTMHKLDNLKHTCEFLMTSESLKKLFAIILTLGNYMNGGNGQRGQADGFGLEILSKLKDVKSKQSNVTLLHFIVRTYMRACGGALAAACALPVPEPGDVARAAALDFQDVAAGLAALTHNLEACKEKTKKILDSGAHLEESPSGEGPKRLEVFREKMSTFLNAAEEKLKTEYENLEDCRSKFIATIKFYQYTPKCGKVEDCEPKEFFSLWTSFCSDFKDIYKKEEQIAIKEKLKEAKKMQEERKSLTQPKKEGGLKARLQKLSSTRK